jgi:serine protease AprX
MVKGCLRQRALRTLAVVVCAGVSLVVTANDGSAQSGSAQSGRRPRLSSDLRRQIDNGNPRDASVILTAAPARVQRIATRHGLTITKWLDHAAVVSVPAHALIALAEDSEVDQLTTNQTLSAQDAVTNETIGADLVQAGTWDDGGGEAYDGRGVGVALIDSGVALLPQLAGRIVARVDFTTPGGSGLDAYGHGTHVAGIIASQSARRDGDGGVSPGAHIVSLKVLDEHGLGTADDVIEALDWTVANAKKFRIRVINLSLGGPVLQPSADDPICQAVERAYRAGLVVVVSAGNFGKSADGRKIYGGITTPGISPYALTVGAVNTKGTSWPEDDEVASYSSRGPTLFDRLIKPDLVAPGNRIESLAAPGSTLVTKYPELVTGSGSSARLTLSGTSMAAGVASGAVALLANAYPAAPAEGIRHQLQRTAIGLLASNPFSAGAGAVNIAAALRLGTSTAAGIAFCTRATCGESSSTWPVGVTSETIVWSDSLDETIVWSDNEDMTIVWSDATDETIVWSDNETIVWSDWDKTIVWSDSDETIVWSDSDETIVWSDTVVSSD